MDFSKFQFGIDIATSLAILFSAGTFLVNQYVKNKEQKRRELDASVRAVTVHQFQETLGKFSHFFVSDIVKNCAMLDNLVGDLERLVARVEANPDLADRAFKNINEAHSAIASFIDSVYSSTYQIYPLLDSVEGGNDRIHEIKEALNTLTQNYNEMGRNKLSLMSELIDLVNYCKTNTIEQADGDVLQSKLLSITLDPDYQGYINLLVPDGQQQLYWQGEVSEERSELRKLVASRLLSFCYESPATVLSQAIVHIAQAILPMRTRCKEFLVSLAAINYWLIRKADDNESLPDVIQRYNSTEMFDSVNTIR